MQVTRERLMDELSAPGHLVIWASPGSGKSTLLRQWADAATAAGGSVAVIDGRVAEPHRFVPAVLAPIDVLVVDNADALKPPARAAVAALLEDEGVPRLIVAGRSDPFPVSPARWMTTRELRTADLAFTRDEVDVLLQRRGIALEPATATMLHERTAGWATGLALASHLLANRSDAEAAAREFGGDHRAMGDYLLGEVLGTLTEPERTVLVRSAVRERVAPELAAVLSGEPEAGRILSGIARRNLLLDRQADGDIVFHPVLLAYLEAEARRSGADAHGSHALAARWFLAAGRPDEALEHAIASGDPETAAAVLRVHGIALTARGVVGLRAAVQLAAAAEPALAALYARMAEAPYLTGADDPGAVLERLDTGSPARAAVAAVLAELWRSAGGEAADAGVVAALGPSPEEVAAVAVVAVLRARIATTAEQGPDRTHALERLRTLIEQTGDQGFPWLRAVAIEAVVACSLGTAHWRDAEGIIRSASAHPLPAEASTSVAGSRLLLLEVDLAYLRAEHLPERAMRLLLSHDFGARHPETQRRARAVGMLDDIASSQTREDLQRFDALAADAANDPAFLSFVLVPWMSAAQHHANHPVLESIGWSARQVFGPHAVETLLAAFLNGPDRDAELALRAAIDSGAPTWDPLTVAHARLRLAVHAQLRGASAKARADLTEAVMISTHYRAVRPFLLFDGDALGMLSGDCARLGPWSAAAADLLTAARDASGPSDPAISSLTSRERSLLDELPVHQTIAEIARRQQVSPNTIKSQLKSVYRKLGVDNRADAVAVGRGVGLIG